MSEFKRALQEFSIQTAQEGLQIAPENVQQQPPRKYLGVKTLDQTIQAQTIQFSTKTQTLNDAQKLLGIINWMRSYLGLTTPQLAPLFNFLNGDAELTSSRKLTPEAKTAVELVERAITNRQMYLICPKVFITVLCWFCKYTFSEEGRRHSLKLFFLRASSYV